MCVKYAMADMRSLGEKRSGTYPTTGGRSATTPRVGLDRPTAIRSSVDFPEPFPPVNATTSPPGA